MNESSDSRFFSQRAKHISLLNEQTPSTVVQPSGSEVHFQFSNRAYLPIIEPPTTPVGRGYGSTTGNDTRQSISVGRGRRTVPLSSFVLQKDNLSTTSTSIFVMHDEVQFVRPYFGPRSTKDIETASLSRNREVLLTALKEIESGLNTL